MMRTAVLATMVVVAAARSAFSNSSPGFQFVPTPEGLNSMLSLVGKRLSGEESLPEARRVLLDAGLLAGEEFLTRPENAAGVARAMSKHFPTTPTATEVADKVRSLVHATTEAEITAADGLPTLGDDQYPYFGFIPPMQGAVKTDGSMLSFSTPCWKTIKATAVTNADSSVTITMSASGQLEKSCSSHFLLATVETLQIGIEIGDEGDHTFTWKANPSRTEAESFDLTTNGVRVFLFTDGVIETIIQIVDTALLFVPEVINPVGAAATKRNLYFMKEYANVDMLPRKTPVVSVDESTIQSGDFFGIIRLDGLDPMLGWAMGSTTGHTTIALRDEITNELYITEATVKDDYWPTNGIQKTPYSLWIQQAINASYQVVHAPLTPEAAASFNLTNAWKWFNKTQGLDYGYHNMLWGWVDTLKDNYPCTPPDFSSKCLEWSHIEVLFPIVNRLVPYVGNLLFMQAWNLRMGTVDLPPEELFMMATKKGMNPAEIPAIVEQDSWVYNTTRYGKPAKGPSSVCCVHVCRTWKAAGVFDSFDSEVNCAELTNWDDYALTILQAHPTRPQACVEADPDNALCQLVGDYTLQLNNLSTKKPFAHMAEKCPSEAPHYTKPADC